MPIENPQGAAPVEPTVDTPVTEPVLSADEQALAAMDQGFSEAEPKDEAPAAPAEPVTPVTPAEPAPVVPGDANAAKPATPEPAAPVKDEAMEREIVDLGLKGKANERFREMAAEIKTLAPVKAAMEQAGIKDLAELPKLVEHAGFGRELFQQVTDTGASAEQYGMALDYLSLVTKANTGDVKAAEQCYAMMSEELAGLAKMLGKEVPGIHDPLAEHADLKLQVEEGDLSRERALEMVRLRNTVALTEAQRQAASTRQTSESQQQAAISQGTNDLNALGNELAASDPHYAAKQPMLLAQIRAVMDDLPPAKWAAKARALYAALPNPVVAAAPAPVHARPLPSAIRGSNLRQPVLPTTDDPMEALEQAFAQR